MGRENGMRQGRYRLLIPSECCVIPICCLPFIGVMPFYDLEGWPSCIREIHGAVTTGPNGVVPPPLQNAALDVS